MSLLKVDEITDAAGTGPVQFSQGYKGHQALATGADANTVLTSSSERTIIVTPTATRDYTLPSTGIKAGDVFTIINLAAASSGFNIVIKASDASTVRTVYPKGSEGKVIALQDAPTTNSHWEGIGQITSPWVSFAPTYSDSTGHVYATEDAIWRRQGRDLLVKINLVHTTGSNGSGTGTWFIDNPTGLDFDGTSIIGGDCTMRRSNNSAGFFGDQSNGTLAIGGGGNIAKFYVFGQSYQSTGGEQGMTSLDVQDFGVGANQYDLIHGRLQHPIASWTDTKG